MIAQTIPMPLAEYGSTTSISWWTEAILKTVSFLVVEPD